jgi:hypothetical protein
MCPGRQNSTTMPSCKPRLGFNQCNHLRRATAEQRHGARPVLAQHCCAVPGARPRALPLDSRGRPLLAAQRQRVHAGLREGARAVDAAEHDQLVIAIPHRRVLPPRRRRRLQGQQATW